MRPTPATTKNALAKLLWVFLLIALAIIMAFFLLYKTGTSNSIEHRTQPSTEHQRQ